MPLEVTFDFIHAVIGSYDDALSVDTGGFTGVFFLRAQGCLEVGAF